MCAKDTIICRSDGFRWRVLSSWDNCFASLFFAVKVALRSSCKQIVGMSKTIFLKKRFLIIYILVEFKSIYLRLLIKLYNKGCAFRYMRNIWGKQPFIIIGSSLLVSGAGVSNFPKRPQEKLGLLWRATAQAAPLTPGPCFPVADGQTGTTKRPDMDHGP